MASSSSVGPYCPDCAGILRVVARYSNGLPRHHCPRCGWDSGEGREQNVAPGYAWTTSPDDPARCRRCGAWHSRYDSVSQCRRCGAPRQLDVKEERHREPIYVQRQSSAPQVAPTPQQPDWTPPFQPFYGAPPG